MMIESNDLKFKRALTGKLEKISKVKITSGLRKEKNDGANFSFFANSIKMEFNFEEENVGKGVGKNDGVSDCVNEGVSGQEAINRGLRKDHQESKNQRTINDLSGLLDDGWIEIKSDIKCLRKNKIISRTSSIKSCFWVVVK